MLKRENYLDSIVPQCSPSAEGAVTFCNAAFNGNIISGGVEIQFRGGVFTTNDPDAIKLLDHMVMRNQGISRAEDQGAPVDPLAGVVKQQAAEVTQEAKEATAADAKNPVVAAAQAAAAAARR